MLQNLKAQVEHKSYPAATRQRMRWVGLALATAIAYFLSARLSLALLTEPDGVAVFWPAAGVSAGLIIALGPKTRWPVTAGAFVATLAANLLGDRNLWSGLVFAASNGLEAILAAWLVQHYFGPNFYLDRLSHVLGLLAAAMVAAAVSGITGTLGYVLFHSSSAPVLTIWHHWFASDALGIIAVAPVLIGIASAMRNPPPRAEFIHGMAALAALTLTTGVIVLLPPQPWTIALPIGLLFPLILWPAARCQPVFASAAAFLLALAIVWTTTFGIGLFGDPSYPSDERIPSAQASILAVSLCTLVLAALFAERRRTEIALEDGESLLQEALAAGGVTAFEWDCRSGSSSRSDNAAQILGFDPNKPFSAAEFLAHVHPDDRPRFKAAIYGVRPSKPSYALTFRFVRADGREVWLEETSRAEFDAAGRYLQLKGLTLDITERKRAEERQDLLISELDHRVKNILARVAVVAKYTRQGSHSIEEFLASLDGRIQSMADAHALLSQSRWRGVALAELVRRQLAPYTTSTNTVIGGPDVTLSAEGTQALAMVLQELVTNAVKYGALSTSTGRVSVNWYRQPPEQGGLRVKIVWRETGGPPAAAPSRFGYGTRLIRDLIPHELGGKVEILFESEGLHCEIEIPDLV
jgi:PAS domain S-box-containing protein